MKTHWIVEDNVFHESIQPLKEEIKNQGMRVEEVGLKHYFGEKSYDMYPENTCVLVYGSLQLCAKLRGKPWYPGVIATLDNYRCSTYYAHFGKYLLNNDYVMLPFNELYRRLPDLFSEKGEAGALFIRPDDGYKSFTGNLVYNGEHEDALKLMEGSIEASIDSSSVCGQPKSSLVVVAPPYNVLKEWRFFVVDRKVITGSRYKTNGKLDIADGYDPVAFEVAQQIVDSTQWQPDPAYSLDICKTASGYSLMEIGAFSCSGMYRASLPELVKAVSEVAEREWSAVN